ncbi:hypothetical protein MK851_07880 [Tenacibaculum sp. 1B UA]|uniref:hypothetical protein n=1 Tax=Tenacibaculum sp. 1B UA TaxID=2922252 RepID=UPI002A23ED44|nr:hypothetical protein [Tenacibaculum sp. 1B UA]MDX8553539.1 hypothetical protein [Tenacibaculum sp. 1B UA]
MESCTTAIIDEGSVSELEPIERTVTYQSDVKAIMDNYCITCHGGPAPQGSLDLTSFFNTRNAALNRNLVERMNSQTNPMPPNGRLNPQILQLIDKWVEDGLLEQ